MTERRFKRKPSGRRWRQRWLGGRRWYDRIRSRWPRSWGQGLK